MDRYMVVARDAVIEFVEKRSRFIGHVWYCSEEAQALERIKEMRENIGMRHITYMLIL